jgi:hypothetical protein
MQTTIKLNIIEAEEICAKYYCNILQDQNPVVKVDVKIDLPQSTTLLRPSNPYDFLSHELWAMLLWSIPENHKIMTIKFVRTCVDINLIDAKTFVEHYINRVSPQTVLFCKFVRI